MRKQVVLRPWTRLQDVAGLLGVGEESLGGVANVVFDSDGEEYERMMESLGLGDALTKDEAKNVLKSRTEVRR
jgi:hypothetical protein